jgi:hypothetical protein
VRWCKEQLKSHLLKDDLFLDATEIAIRLSMPIVAVITIISCQAVTAMADRSTFITTDKMIDQGGRRQTMMDTGEMEMEVILQHQQSLHLRLNHIQAINQFKIILPLLRGIRVGRPPLPPPLRILVMPQWLLHPTLEACLQLVRIMTISQITLERILVTLFWQYQEKLPQESIFMLVLTHPTFPRCIPILLPHLPLAPMGP